MNPADMMRIVDSIHREKNIEKDVVFQAIESALVSAAKKSFGELADITLHIDRTTGALSGTLDGEVMDPEEISGRIGAQTAKQVIIQKIREAERDSLLGEFGTQIGQMVNGTVTRIEGGATIVALSNNVEAILPRSEQIPGESHQTNERVRAIIFEVKPQGSRVKVVLSRTRPQLVQRLFEQEIPEVSEGVITINAIAREPAHRSKVAVSSTDQRVDCVGACVGIRGNRIKNIVDELSGERIDIIRWSDDPETLIREALKPSEVDQVLLCDMIGRAIVLVREDQLSLAIGRKGQNVRLASKLCGWDIEIMTNDELEQQIDRAVAGFMQIEGMTEELAQRLVEQGYLSYDDLEVIEPDALMELGGMTEEQVDKIVTQAEVLAVEAGKVADAEKQRKRIEDNEAAAAGKPVTKGKSANRGPAKAPPPAEVPPAEVPPAEAPAAETPPAEPAAEAHAAEAPPAE
ncbi:transcription termination factor NusA [Anatilimnocola sp. NA78]|uniref:transcription termination factor NusA n=1 Tax=Anatilimnocola sp. NA78 TaxID=3415683 RepID=UPI003CE4612B